MSYSQARPCPQQPCQRKLIWLSSAAAESWCKKCPPPPQIGNAYALQPPFPSEEPKVPQAPDAAKVRLFPTGFCWPPRCGPAGDSW